ncbi:ABC transporter permease [Terrihabitans rhizophilus]|uniref:ABC transporter permease subunit n=1 Tax=Terrihabitans rhizophilus TaxID=3092662 RepID=A0ABU4RPI6_9HYPH|nr:ABC transporter permease subunit [Terrihabitans sp. PJ23]MDX6806753.1 ABC transporter permease subunit [Terrihabitans sp. PJ23]
MSLDLVTNPSQPQAKAAGLAPSGGKSWAGSILLWRLASIALFCGLWEIAGRIPINVAFPPFSDVVAAFGRLVADGSLPSAFLVTLQPLVIGIVVSAVVGVSVGVAMGLRKEFEWAGVPVFVVMQAAPMAALIPLITFVYGIGLTAKVLAVIMLALPVIALNGYKAVSNVSPSLRAMCRSFLGNSRQDIFKIVLPDASPMIFAGLRLGISAGFVGVVLAELLITPTGVGDLITYHRSVADYAEMYAVIATIIIFSAVVVSLLERAEIVLFRPEKRELSA